MFGQFDDLGVSDKVSPVHVEDGAETTPMDALEETDVAPVGHLQLEAVVEGW